MMIFKTFSILQKCLCATAVPKKFFLLNQSEFETSFLTLKCARCLDFKGLPDNHDKMYKFFETYELD